VKDQEENDDVLDLYLLHAAENQLQHDLKKMVYLYNSCCYQKIITIQPTGITKMDKKHWHFLKEVSGNSCLRESPLDIGYIHDGSQDKVDDIRFSTEAAKNC